MSRKSGMPYFSMAIRSSPMPNAKPWYLSGSSPQFADHVGMHHAAAKYLEPFPGLADRRRVDVDLHRRLGEREMRRAEPHLHLVDLEERLAEFFQAPLEVAHVRGLVDHQRFDLVEHRRVRGVAVASGRHALAR